jgi:hypothetical protein
LLRENMPSPTGKCFLRLRISNRLIFQLGGWKIED